MRNWWNWLLIFGLVCLLFLAIPLSYPKSKSKEQLQLMFNDYIKKFNKTYKDNATEYATRFEHFVASVQEIEQMNAASRGPESHKARYGLTHLSDMSKEEYKEIHLSDEKPHRRRRYNLTKTWSYGQVTDIVNVDGTPSDLDLDPDYFDDHHVTDLGNRGSHHNVYNIYNIVIRRKKRAALPLKMDWRDKGLVGPVRDQGLCGACWAFSTIGVMETMAALSTGKLAALSVQEAIDCAGLGNAGCAGGDICLLLDWLAMTKTPVQPDKDYPLKLTNAACALKKNVTGVRVKSYTCETFVGSEEKLLESIATHGPVAVAVNALSWQNYLGGVIQFHCSGSPVDLNHAVELVGYDLTADVPYYIAKNSWGSAFGNAGYLQLAIGSNVCGLANEVALVDVSV
ncbi:cathepsin O-like [Aricia agestis]|uniref:cathepsin O-like n=1 Tax=Aricia agestis TaxID=91739 RepID=UPI001C2044B5|nr:cathepsin O-like [Aricia agestis]